MTETGRQHVSPLAGALCTVLRHASPSRTQRHETSARRSPLPSRAMRRCLCCSESRRQRDAAQSLPASLHDAPSSQLRGIETSARRSPAAASVSHHVSRSYTQRHEASARRCPLTQPSPRRHVLPCAAVSFAANRDARETRSGGHHAAAAPAGRVATPGRTNSQHGANAQAMPHLGSNAMALGGRALSRAPYQSAS